MADHGPRRVWWLPVLAGLLMCSAAVMGNPGLEQTGTLRRHPLLASDLSQAISAAVESAHKLGWPRPRLLRSGCEWAPCTSVVTRFADFLAKASPLSADLQREDVLACIGTKERWTCEPQTFVVAPASHHQQLVQVHGELDTVELVLLMAFVQSAQFEEQLSALEGYDELNRSIVRSEPRVHLERKDAGFLLNFSGDGLGLYVKVSKGSGDISVARYRVDSISRWIS